MRPHGHARADRHSPRAWAICDSCGFLYNKSDLQWQFDWAGNKLVNQNFLVCNRCYDEPQEQLRSIVLPADPTPIVNPRPERANLENNPVSSLGQTIGTMTQGAGLAAAFDSNTNKPMFLSAVRYVSANGDNYVGRYWFGLTTNNAGIVASAFQVWAPNNAKLFGGGSVPYAFQGSPDNAIWTALASGATAGTVGEIIAVTLPVPNTAYLYHRLVLTGDGINSVAVAQLQISQAG